MERITFLELMKHSGVSEGDCNKIVSNTHLECISRTCCKHWKSLPAHLGLDTIVAEDIDGSKGDERTKRHRFLLKWEEIKGSGATYKQLITALLTIECRQDAERVCEMLKESISVTSTASALPIGSPATRNYRMLLNEYCQKNSASLREEFIKDPSTGKPLFKCTITCQLEGSKIVEDSGQTFPRKDDAKEAAAHKIWVKIKEREKSSSRVSNASWKSQLKEHYDKQGKPGLELNYEVTELNDGGFEASISIKELGKVPVKGEKARTKKEAEQNAAKRAMQLLSK